MTLGLLLACWSRIVCTLSRAWRTFPKSWKVNEIFGKFLHGNECNKLVLCSSSIYILNHFFNFRVDGLMMNSRSFNEAFECPAGSRMNPQKKCGIWTNWWDCYQLRCNTKTLLLLLHFCYLKFLKWIYLLFTNTTNKDIKNITIKMFVFLSWLLIWI